MTQLCTCRRTKLYLSQNSRTCLATQLRDSRPPTPTRGHHLLVTSSAAGRGVADVVVMRAAVTSRAEQNSCCGRHRARFASYGTEVFCATSTSVWPVCFWLQIKLIFSESYTCYINACLSLLTHPPPPPFHYTPTRSHTPSSLKGHKAVKSVH